MQPAAFVAHRNCSPARAENVPKHSLREVFMSSYTVLPGDTLSGIAAAKGLSLKALETANPQVRNPDLIRTGQQLTLPDAFSPAKKAPVSLGNGPASTSYTVQSGDTLSAIGAKFGVSTSSIAQANGIANPDAIRAGQVLKVPGANGAPPLPPAKPSATTYRVSSGDTLGGIAAKYGLPAASIAQANGLSNPDLIFPGQVLRIPTAAAPVAATPPAKGSPAPSGGAWVQTPGALSGEDSSAWQSDAQFQQSIQGAQWTAIKATEGTTFTDPTFQTRWNELGQKVQSGQMKLRVAYDFLDPGNGTAQAQHFLDTLGVKGPLPAGTRLALDWEGSALSDPQALTDAANQIHQVTGLWPLVYTSASNVPAAKAAVPNAPLWEADWGAPDQKNVPFDQVNDGPGVDHDVFNGNLAALEKFAGWTGN
jgi:LysM repeat protein